MKPTGTTSRRTLIYTDSLWAPSETFVTALIDYMTEVEPRLAILTHAVYGDRRPGVPVTVIPRRFERGTLPWMANAALRVISGRELFELRLRPFLERAAPDTVHAQFGQPGYRVFEAISRGRAGAPRLVVNFFGYDATGLLVDAPEWRPRYRELFAYPDLAVVVEGPVMKSRLLALGCPEDKLHVVPLCLKLTARGSEPASRTEARNGGLVIGMVGRFVEKKGFRFALTHLAPLLKANPGVRVVMVGDGPERGAIERLIAEQGLAEQVALRGLLPYEALLREIRAMSVLLVPSLTAANGDSEGGAPTLIAEAQVVGVPVIASDHADIPFALHDHNYMFKEGDALSFAEVCARYMQEAGCAYDVRRARARTLEKHDKKSIQARYAALYRRGDS